MRWCSVVVVLNAMHKFLFFNKLVIFMIFGLWKVNVVQIFFVILASFFLTLCSICRLSFSSRWRVKLLFLGIDCIIYPSVCFLSGLRGLVMWNLKAAIFCSMGWFERKLTYLANLYAGINNRTAPTYKLARYITKTLDQYISLNNYFNATNSTKLANDLTKLKIHENYRMISFDIKDLYVCSTCYKAYVEQTSRNLKSRFREHIIWYIKNSDPRSAYALHILNLQTWIC